MCLEILALLVAAGVLAALVAVDLRGSSPVLAG